MLRELQGSGKMWTVIGLYMVELKTFVEKKPEEYLAMEHFTGM